MYPSNQFVEVRVSEVDDKGKSASGLTFKYININNIAICFPHPISYATIIRVVIGYQAIDYIVHNEDCDGLMNRINNNRYEMIINTEEQEDNKAKRNRDKREEVKQ